MEAWAFLNHISLLLYYLLRTKMYVSGLSEIYRAQNIMDTYRDVYQMKFDDGQDYISELSKQDAENLEKIKVAFPHT